MFKKAKKYILIFLIVLLLLVSIPFLTKKKVDLDKISELAKRYKLAENENVKVKLISDNKEALDTRVALIESAKESIDLSYYRINSSDETSQVILNALIDASNRGVKVRLVVDAKFGGLDKKVLSLLTEYNNIKVYYYNPLNIRKPESLQVSLHNKVLIVDNEWILSGGRNISDSFLSNEGFPSYDLDVLIHSTNKQDTIHTEFNQLFDELINPKYTKIKLHRNQKNDSIKNEFQNSYSNYKSNNNYNEFLKNIKNEMYTVDSINVVFSSLKPENKEPLIGHIMYEVSKNSNGDVYIQSPYITGDKIIVNALASLAKDKEVTLLTNSLSSSPNFPAYSNYLFNRKKFMKTGINIYEYINSENESIHTKAFILADDISAVGSMNLDNRSLFINSEQMLIIKSQEFHSDLMEVMNSQMNHSALIGDDLKEHKKVNESHVSFTKKLLMKITGILLRPFQSLL